MLPVHFSLLHRALLGHPLPWALPLAQALLALHLSLGLSHLALAHLTLAHLALAQLHCSPAWPCPSVAGTTFWGGTPGAALPIMELRKGMRPAIASEHGEQILEKEPKVKKNSQAS